MDKKSEIGSQRLDSRQHKTGGKQEIVLQLSQVSTWRKYPGSKTEREDTHSLAVSLS